MSSEIDIAAHTMSAGGGAFLTILVDRLIRFFTERSKRAEEIKLAERLTSIESKLAEIMKALESHNELAERVARLEGRRGRR